MKRFFIEMCLISAIAFADANAAPELPKYGYADQAIETTNSLEHHVSCSTNFAGTLLVSSQFGTVRKSVTQANWIVFANSIKQRILADLATAGWKVWHDGGTKPDARFSFRITINATRESEQLEIRAVIFQEKNGEADISFFEQKMPKAERTSSR